jgi:hypothetical protein
MSEAVQIAPLLSLFSDDGEFTLRVDDSPLAKVIAPSVIKAIGEQERARKLTLLTPTDTKIFKFDGKHKARPQEPVEVPEHPQRPVRPLIIEQDDSAPPSPELVALDAEQQEAIRAQREIERLNGSVVQMPSQEEPTTSRRVKRPTGDEKGKNPPAPCGGCQGAGTRPGGGACPVCRGTGQIAHFGRRARG